jgi:branched-chain amino acid transport system permease protein
MGGAEVLLFVQQVLNGVQLGLMLFLLSAGLTLVFGMMDFLNLAHGTFFMGGAFLGAWINATTGNVWLAIAGATAVMLAVGALLELGLLRGAYSRGHLDQILITVGLIYIGNDAVRMIWGSDGLAMLLPPSLNTSVSVLGLHYSLFKLVFIAATVLIAGALAFVLAHTRIGMWIRAGAADRETAIALGVDVKQLFTLVFACGAALAGLAGALSAPLLSASLGMGETILVPCLVVIVLGGVGSVTGAFLAALVVGLVDVLGRTYATALTALVVGPTHAATLGPSLSSMLIYLLMAAVLVLRPRGLMGRAQP